MGFINKKISKSVSDNQRISFYTKDLELPERARHNVSMYLRGCVRMEKRIRSQKLPTEIQVYLNYLSGFISAKAAYICLGKMSSPMATSLADDIYWANGKEASKW